MKILYAIQGTGNGHMARAFEVIPQLKRYGKVDILVSGIQADIKLPWPVKYKYYGMSFIFGTNGGVDVKATLMKARPFKFIKEVLSVPVHRYDLVLNDFEPVVAWASKIRAVRCIGVSHQSAVLHPEAPLPSISDCFGKAVLKYYAPVKKSYGFHFKALGKHINTPVIRADIRNAKAETKGHYTVYLPSYSDDRIIACLSQVPYINWQVFSKHNKEAKRVGNISIQPVNKERFTKSFVSCTGILCNAGFETPAEALHMGKKLCVIPMKGQYEQQCNAAFLKSMGIRTLQDLEGSKDAINEWVFFENAKTIEYPNNIEGVIDRIISTNTLLCHSIPQMA